MYLLVLFFVGFVLVHFAKMFRLYLVLMEHKIPFGRFVLLYLKTTLVNFIIPFKIGEVYRFYCISRETKHWQVGILSILVDRFFDILALCAVLIPCDILIARNRVKMMQLTDGMPDRPFLPVGVLSDITLLFLAILILIAVCYITVLPTYRYLNRYLIKEKSSQRSLAALKGLDVVKQWYDFTQNLISGRFALIFLFSFVGWIFEIGTLTVLAKYLTKPFRIADFETYIQAIFGMGTSDLLKPYTLYSVILMAVFTLVALIIYIANGILHKEINKK